MNLSERMTIEVSQLIQAQMPLQSALEFFQDRYVAAAMEATGQNVTHAAHLLGVHRNTMHNKLRMLRKRSREAQR